MAVQTLWGFGTAHERGWMVMRAEFVIKVGVGNRIRRKNWPCTTTEIHSLDQNFIFPTRCGATNPFPNLPNLKLRKSAKATAEPCD
jgi:hypothetical protein